MSQEEVHAVSTEEPHEEARPEGIPEGSEAPEETKEAPVEDKPEVSEAKTTEKPSEEVKAEEPSGDDEEVKSDEKGDTTKEEVAQEPEERKEPEEDVVAENEDEEPKQEEKPPEVPKPEEEAATEVKAAEEVAKSATSGRRKSRPSTAAKPEPVENKKPPPPEEQDIKEVEEKIIELSISCRNLKNKDFLSKSDPMAIVFMKKKGESDWSEIGRTEMIQDDLNPDFVTKVELGVNPDKDDVEIPLKFVIYDVDKPGQVEVHDTDTLGLVEVNLAEILNAVESDKFFNIGLKELGAPDKAVGTMHLEVEMISCSVKEAGEKMLLKLSGKNVFQGKGLFTPKLFYIISKKSPKSGNFTPIYRSEDFKGKEPVWANQAVVGLATLCNGDRDRELKIDVYSEKSMKETHKPIAYTFTSLNAIIEAHGSSKTKGALTCLGISDGKLIPSASIIVNEVFIGH